MKILKIIGIVVLVAIVAAGIMASMQPAQGHIEQSIVINASPATVYRELNGWGSFTKWSPWAKMDPATKYSYEGPESGVGAKMSWTSEKVGNGSQTISEAVENQKLRLDLKFDGMDGKAWADFIIEPQGDGTKLTWTYDGDNDGLMGKFAWMFISTMLNDQYAQGVNDLKTYIESLPPAMPDTTMIMK